MALFPAGGSFSVDGVHSDTWRMFCSGWQIPILPSLRLNLQDIPGRAGKVSTGIEYSSRIMNMSIVCSEPDRTQFLRHMQAFAAAIDPRVGAHKIILLDDNPNQYVNALPSNDLQATSALADIAFSLALELADPFWYATTSQHFALTSAQWTALPVLPNAGNEPTPPKFTIQASGGNITSITLTLGGKSATYSGTIGTTDTVVIDCGTGATGRFAVTKNGNNDIADWSGDFPKVPAGGGQLTGAVAGAGTPVLTIDYTERWT